MKKQRWQLRAIPGASYAPKLRGAALILLAALALLSAAGCGETDASESAAQEEWHLITPAPTAEPTPSPTPEPTPEYVLRERVPILMYHALGDGDNNLYLELDLFREQLDWMEEHGVHPVTLKELYAHWYEGAWLPEKPIVLTFDDGYREMYTEAYPRLAEKGFTAVFFVFPSARWSDAFMLQDMTTEMAEGGMEIGCHTYTHADVSALGEADLEYQIAESKTVLESYLPYEVDSFCYPSGGYSDASRAKVAETGYQLAVTTEWGIASVEDDPMLLPRVRISRGNGAAYLEEVLAELGY